MFIAPSKFKADLLKWALKIQATRLPLWNAINEINMNFVQPAGARRSIGKNMHRIVRTNEKGHCLNSDLLISWSP